MFWLRRVLPEAIDAQFEELRREILKEDRCKTELGSRNSQMPNNDSSYFLKNCPRFFFCDSLEE